MNKVAITSEQDTRLGWEYTGFVKTETEHLPFNAYLRPDGVKIYQCDALGKNRVDSEHEYRAEIIDALLKQQK